MTRLLIHLGDRKTGSTSIQRTLADRLWRAGDDAPRLAYPARLHNGPLAQSLANFQDTDKQAARFENLARRLGRLRGDADLAILSSETFEDVSPVALKRAIDTWLPDWRDGLRLVAYARPHGARFLSAYAEQVKRGQTWASPEEFFAEGVLLERFTMAERFSTWRKVFGEAFELRPAVDKCLVGGSVVDDFLTCALGCPVEVTWAARSNPSPDAAALAALRIIHGARDAAGLSPRALERGGLAFAEALAEQPGTAGEKPGLTAALLADLRELCAEDAAILDEQFFDGTPMGDALAALQPGGAGVAPEDHFSAQTQRIIAALAVSLPLRDPAQDPADPAATPGPGG